MPKSNCWDAKSEKQLCRLWADGMSITDMGAKMGLSRGAVAGKVNRSRDKLGLGNRRRQATKTKNNMVVPLLERKNLPQRLTLRRINWAHSACSWPVGDPQDKDFYFCGKKTVPGRPYCDEHCVTAYSNLRDST